MKHILVIADPQTTEQLALRRALELAQLSDCKLHIAIFCYEPLGQIVSHDDPEHSNLKVRLIQHHEKWWQDHLDKLGSSIEISHEVVWEKHIHHWLLQHCKICDYDLIMKTGHRSENMLYTPTDWQLLRESTVPVYIASPLPHGRKTVLAAVDLLSKSDEKQALNRKVIEAAFRLSVQVDSDLQLCYTVKIPTLVNDLDLIDTSLHSHKIEKQAREAAVPLLEEYQLTQDSLHISSGLPGEVISKLANKLKAQCTVIGSIGRRGISGKLIGNTSEKALRYTRGDILVVSPD